MLVTFKTSAHADIIMFGDVAKQLLKMMGHSGTVPSAMVAEEVPAALDRLKHAVEAKRADEEQKPRDNAEQADDQSVSLKYRALPLIELLSAAARKRCDVMWDKT
ncbi:protein of unknown function [Nitrosospira multiformis]|uniref:DUF1840 domain-containing protein n=1 Tax=Nitrosospira multiformis TaxID=1231 RepID=A0A1H8BU78_9PROT|nr:DUF1840 domain-containing protein [Nitrosospira multiformis]SEM86425.1 protein of unknown function [Nitrosospira multiformis]